MSIIAAARDELITHIQSLCTATVSNDRTVIVHALADGRSAVWVGPPEQVAPESPQVWLATFEIAVLAQSQDPLTDVDKELDLAEELVKHLPVTELRTDVLSLTDKVTIPAVMLTIPLRLENP